MRSLFTVHAGEYILGSYIENKFKDLDVWLPSRDTGIDLLVTNPSASNGVSIQVKFSTDLLPRKTAFLQSRLTSLGWWTLYPNKLKKSTADLWVFALTSFYSNKTQFLVIPPKRLFEILRVIHGDASRWHVYFAVSKKKKCWQTSGLLKDEMIAIAENVFVDEKRDLSQWLNNWDPLENLSH